MTVARTIPALAGFMILLSIALAYLMSPYWCLLTAFVGVNLFQSTFTGFCPAASFLRKAGVPRS